MVACGQYLVLGFHSENLYTTECIIKTLFLWSVDRKGLSLIATGNKKVVNYINNTKLNTRLQGFGFLSRAGVNNEFLDLPHAVVPLVAFMGGGLSLCHTPVSHLGLHWRGSSAPALPNQAAPVPMDRKSGGRSHVLVAAYLQTKLGHSAPPAAKSCRTALESDSKI